MGELWKIDSSHLWASRGNRLTGPQNQTIFEAFKSPPEVDYLNFAPKIISRRYTLKTG